MQIRQVAIKASPASRGVLKRALSVLFIFFVVGIAGVMATAAKADVPRAYAGIVVDAKTGNTLYSYAADSPRYPASVTKVMTLYVLFQELKAGRMTLNTPLSVSNHAAAAEPTKLYVRAGSTIKVEDAIKALVTLSANDVARVIAENISGTESEFAVRMTQTARALGMNRTTYANASGLPDSRQVTTVRDQTRLAIAIYQHFPDYYEYFQTRSFNYRGNSYGNHNRLLGQNGVDGIKTGYIRASGYNLMTAARKDNRHIVVVAFGFDSGGSRNSKVAELVRTYLPRARSGSYWAQAMIPELGAGNRFAVAAATPVIPMPRPSDRMPVTMQPAIVPEVIQVASNDNDIVIPAPLPDTLMPGNDETMLEPIALVEPATRPATQQVALAPIPLEPPVDLMANPAAQATANIAGVTSASPQQGPFDVIGAWLSDSFSLDENTGAGNQAGGALTLVPPAPIGNAPAGDQAIDLMTSGSVDAVAAADTGWVIQLGAAHSQDGAQELLSEASTQVSELGDLRPYIEQISNSGQTFYRARFSGFAGRNEAQQVCNQIKEKNMSCLAVQS